MHHQVIYSTPPRWIGNSGYTPLQAVEAIKEGYVIHIDPVVPRGPHQNVKLPPILPFGLEVELPRLNPSAGNNRAQLGEVRLNPKKQERRACKSPTRARGHHHSLPTPPRSPKDPREQRSDEIIETTDPALDGTTAVDVDRIAKRRRTPKSCNRAYTVAQIDWMRYNKIDLGASYRSMEDLFQEVWPNELKAGHCFSAKLYRSNNIPRVDEWNNPLYDKQEKLILDPAKMRDADTEEGKLKCVPYSLVDKYPWRAVDYKWVKEEQKKVARLILRGIDPTDPTGSKSSHEWRLVIRSS
jgi:hypothetical protein